MSKGFRQKKQPTKGDLAKANDNMQNQIQQQQQVFQMMIQQIFKLSQELQHQSRELEALANLVGTQSVYDEAQEGDVIVVNYMGLMKDTMLPFEGGTASRTAVRIGSNSLIAGFEAGLKGLKSGARTVLELTFPEDYHAKDLAGKEVIFEVLVLDVLREIVDPTDFNQLVKETHEKAMAQSEAAKSAAEEESSNAQIEG